MKPTNHLRFVEREFVKELPPFYRTVNDKGEMTSTSVYTVRILQQFWEHDGGDSVAGDMFSQMIGSWRDVPAERE